jgi:hypothetical protein
VDGGDTGRLTTSPDAVVRRLGDELILVNLRTNRIYELNRTAARLWELIAEGRDAGELRQAMLHEFDVEESSLDDEIAALVPVLVERGLVERR